ncbi:hypothetical protein AB0383_08690 [Amycolatopsis sp. NPDC051373]|uniref:hypothetical protein n=1 Tax=Amycolatopsis sp. NPDC051373 TaxID=3155801 RepID=UPI00344E92E5
MAGAEIGTGGQLIVEAVTGSDSIRIEVIPVSSGPKVESWRLFAVGDNDDGHFVYPEAADRD